MYGSRPADASRIAGEARMKQPLKIGRLAVGPPAPCRVVGVMASPVTRADSTPASLPCDLVEVRLDRWNLPPDRWSHVWQQGVVRNIPVLATLRLAAEGGSWTKPDQDRLPILEHVLTAADAMDVEIRSALFTTIAARTAEQGKTLVASFHDFKRTPPMATLCSVLETAAVHPHAVIKLAVRVQSPTDRERLESILHDPPVSNPLCIIGMGPTAADTRITFPALGSCLAYGYVDEPTAPGQCSCQELRQQLVNPSQSGDTPHADS